jgi:hypothetical protein
VLAGDRSAGVDAVLKDLRRDVLGQVALTGDPFVVANQRMQVAVAGMEHVPDAEA